MLVMFVVVVILCLSCLRVSIPYPSHQKDTKPPPKTDRPSDVTSEGVATSPVDVMALQHEVARYKLKAEQLEYKVEEVGDVTALCSFL